ncbi:MAG TPA: hypothetical protein VFF98_18030 [Novosphingobium sp.]|nr:hypothetical protein [Novosphingobium sp.]
MKTLFTVISAAGLAALAPAAGAEAPAGSLFASKIAPIFASNCAVCHLTGEEAGRMSLVPEQVIASTVNVPVNEAPGLTRIVPGKPDESYLVMKLEGTQVAHGGTGARMPFGAAPLSPAEIALVRQWIREGAKP